MRKKYRLTSNHQFQQIIDTKVQLISKSLILYFRKNQLNHLKVGISISKKFINAVHRNRTRRKVRAILIELAKWDLRYDVIIIVRKAFLNKNYQQQKAAVSEMLERLENGTKTQENKI